MQEAVDALFILSLVSWNSSNSSTEDNRRQNLFWSRNVFCGCYSTNIAECFRNM